MEDFKIIFVHGYTASSKADWYPNIIPELEKLGIDFAIPDLPGGEHPHVKVWLRVIHQEVLKTNKPLVLVGHSLGTRLVLLIAAFANRLENANRNDGEAYPDFFVNKIDISKIKSLSEKFIVMHSKDD